MPMLFVCIMYIIIVCSYVCCSSFLIFVCYYCVIVIALRALIVVCSYLRIVLLFVFVCLLLLFVIVIRCLRVLLFCYLCVHACLSALTVCYAYGCMRVHYCYYVVAVARMFISFVCLLFSYLYAFLCSDVDVFRMVIRVVVVMRCVIVVRVQMF